MRGAAVDVKRNAGLPLSIDQEGEAVALPIDDLAAELAADAELEGDVLAPDPLAAFEDDEDDDEDDDFFDDDDDLDMGDDDEDFFEDDEDEESDDEEFEDDDEAE